MDLNRKYAAHQSAVMRAARTTDRILRDGYLADAASIAGEISVFQRTMGAAASCAWSASLLAPMSAGIMAKPQ